eukprot:1157625-Prorocentrum_minimum.AAC.1
MVPIAHFLPLCSPWALLTLHADQSASCAPRMIDKAASFVVRRVSTTLCANNSKSAHNTTPCDLLFHLSPLGAAEEGAERSDGGVGGSEEEGEEEDFAVPGVWPSLGGETAQRLVWTLF